LLDFSFSIELPFSALLSQIITRRDTLDTKTQRIEMVVQITID